MLLANTEFIDQTLEIENYYFTDEGFDCSTLPIEPRNTAGPVTAPVLIQLRSPPSSGSSSISSTLITSGSSTSSAIPRSPPLQLTPGQQNQYEGGLTLPSLSGDEQGVEHPLPIPFTSPRDTQSILPSETHLQSSFQCYTKQPVPPGSENSCRLAWVPVDVSSASQLSPKIWKEQFFWPNASTTAQCICLVRYFVQEVAPQVSLKFSIVSATSSSYLPEVRYLLSRPTFYSSSARTSQKMPTTVVLGFYGCSQTSCNVGKV